MINLRELILEIMDKTIEDFLLYPPEGEDQQNIVNAIMNMESKPNEVYRGVSSAEYKNLYRQGFVISRGEGNTRRGIMGSYVSDSIQLAGRFAFKSYKDTGRGYLLVLDKNKMPELHQADEGNYWTEQIPLDAVVAEYDMQKLARD